MIRATGRLGIAVSAVLLGVLVSGCTGSSVGGSGNQGYVAGKGVITSVKAADRGRPGAVTGTTLSGRRVSLSDYRGKTVVVNVWGSWCSPCRAEAPMLAAASRSLAKDGVVFLGIDSRDPERDGPRAFERRFKIGYESIYDPAGRTLLAFHDTLPANAIPSTVVIDPQGRVSGSVIGTTTRTTLEDLVQDATAGSGA